MNRNIIISGFILLLLFFNQAGFGQKQSLIGINANISADIGYPRTSVGITYDHRFTRHSGFETGVFYRNRNYRLTTTISDSTGVRMSSARIIINHLNIPVLYKYHTKIVDLSAGPAFDVFLNWKQQTGKPGLVVNEFGYKPRIDLGFQAKVSKMIRLNERFILEPEIRYTTIQDLAIGVALKMVL